MLIPSAKAVFPTQGSPIRIGLFLVLLDKTCIDLLISLSLPMIGSILLFFANSVKSIVFFYIIILVLVIIFNSLSNFLRLHILYQIY